MIFIYISFCLMLSQAIIIFVYHWRTVRLKDLVKSYREVYSIYQKRKDELEKAIRSHRDAKGDDRCWLDDEALYAVLGEGNGSLTLPSKEIFLANCAKYHECRQPPFQQPITNIKKGRWVTAEEMERLGID